MNVYHKITRQDCLSHELWPHFKEGWPETDKTVHFFWGLGDNQIEKIQECENKKEEWWYVDLGYMTKQITRYPSPIIHDYDKTYFRIVKGELHTVRGKVGNGKRLRELEQKGIDCTFKGWYTGKTEHILLCPSSQTVTMATNQMNQQDWIDLATNEIRKFTDRTIRIRNKPRPGNEWWNTDIRNDLKNCHALVTNMSLAAVDAVLNKVPVFTHDNNIANFVASKDLKYIEKPMRPGHKTMGEWMKMVVENQFTIDEIKNGTAHKTLMEQIV
jgi:hypothetical protein|tara:strand:+ start:677 stop:1489 length:813 start_codon:yes stop_codon:yes gene_type:complete